MATKVETDQKKESKPISALILLEEDDEFEEFESGEWDDVKEEPDEQIWKDNWDEEDDVEDDFINQLREQIAKNPNGK